MKSLRSWKTSGKTDENDNVGRTETEEEGIEEEG